MVQDVDGGKLLPLDSLEVPPQVVGPRNGRFVTRDECLMPRPDVDFGHGLADEARPARDDMNIVITGVGRMKKPVLPGLLSNVKTRL